MRSNRMQEKLGLAKHFVVNVQGCAFMDRLHNNGELVDFKGIFRLKCLNCAFSDSGLYSCL